MEMDEGRKLIGQILLEEGALTNEQLENALEEQKKTKERLGAILIRQGYISEKAVYRVLARQLGIDYLDSLETVEVESQLLYRIPFRYLEHNCLLPLEEHEGAVKVAMANPCELEVINDLRGLLNCEIKPVMAPAEEVVKALNRCYAEGGETVEKMIQDLTEEELELVQHQEEETGDLLDMASQAPIIKLVNLILLQAIKERASDVHIEPFENDLVVRYRVDGILYEASYPPKRLQAAIVSRVKIMAELNIAERRVPQDGRIELRVGGRDYDVRVSTIPTVFGESVVLRLLDKKGMLMGLEQLGMGAGTLKIISELLKKPHGIILVTGPTGSGKTTTLYASLSRINSADKKIITIEDPVEYQLDRINQIHVNPKGGVTFAAGLRSMLRQDPDVMMVGEIRDLETAEIAVQAALTGHLVFSTLHTNDAPGAITRLLDMGMEPFLVSSSVIAVLAQRLVREICVHCKEGINTGIDPETQLGLEKRAGEKQNKIYRGAGCEHCRRTGFSGRTGIYELMLLTEPIQKLIHDRSPTYVIKKKARDEGMKTLREDGYLKVIEGMTTVEEVLRVTEET